MTKDLRDEFVEDAERERDEEEENKLMDPLKLNRYQKSILEEIEDKAEQLIIKEILLMLEEKQDVEEIEDAMDAEGKLYASDDEEREGERGEEDPEHKTRTRAEEKHYDKILDALEERYKNEYGYELHNIEDEEEFKTAYVEYIKKNLKGKKKQKYKKSIEDIEHERMMRDDAIYKQLFEMLQGADMPITLISGEFVPNKYGRIKEM